MSLHKQKDEGYPNTLVIPADNQDELIHVIQMSLINIATKVNTLSKRAENIIDGIGKEVDRLSFRVTDLEEQVTQKMNGTTYEDQNGELPLRVLKSKTFQSTTIQTQQVYASKQVPVKMCEMHDTHVLTLPMNRSPPFCPDDTGGLEVCPDACYCFELYKQKTVPESEEEKGAKLKQKKQKDHPNKPASVPQTQLMEDDMSVHHAPAACGEVSHSYVGQPDESSPFPSFPLYEINKLVMRAAGKVLSSSHHLPTHLPMHGAREVKTSLPYVRYGTGRGEQLQPQPQNHPKTEVFVSPTAPDPPPALPSDWLATLKASKMETPSSSIHFPTQLPSPVLGTPATGSPAACLPSVPDRDVPIIPPKVDFSTPASEPSPYYKVTTDDLLALAEDEGMPPPLCSSAVTSPSVQTRATVTHLIGPTSVVQSPTPSLKASKMETPSSSIHFPTQLPSPVLGTPATGSPAACLPSVPDRDVPIIPPKVDFTPASEPSPYYEVTTDDLLALAEDEGMPPPLCSSAVTSPSVQTRSTVTHLIGPTSVVQSPTPSLTKLSMSSISLSPRSSLSSLPSYCIPPPRYPVTLLPRSSTPKKSSPLSSMSSCPQTSRSWVPSPRYSLSSSTRSFHTTWSRCSEPRSLRPSAAQSQRSSAARSTRDLIPPQENSSSLKSAKSFTLKSLFSFVQSPSCTLSPSGLSETPSASAPVNATFKQSPPPLPVIAKVRSALLAAIRKGILLYKSEDQ